MLWCASTSGDNPVLLLEAEATATTLLMLGRQKMSRQEILISMRHRDIFSPAYMGDIYQEAFQIAENIWENTA